MKVNYYLGLIFVFFLLVSCRNESGDTSPFQGHWKGFYSGGEYGNWDVDIDGKGSVSGTAKQSGSSYPEYQLNGTVTSDGTFKATVGTTSAGATFIGKLTGNNASGTWTNTYAQVGGTWSGTKQ